jgi:hypothetical protein
MPIAGFTRFRKHQVGKQSSFASNVPATRILPYRGAVVVEPNRTQPDVDTGSLDPILPSFRGANEITGSWDGNAAFDDLPYIYALGVKGSVSPTGANPYTWTYQASSLTADTLDYITDQWGDDVTSDVVVAGSGVIDSFSLSFGEDLGAFDLSAQLVYARAAYGSLYTGGLTIDTTPQWVYGAQTVIYMDSVAGSMGITPIVDAVHSASFTVNNNLDRKRFANGSNTAWELAGFGRGPREIEFTVTLSKTTASVAEAQTLDDNPVPTRYFDVKTTSTETTGGTPYSNSIRFAAELIGREDGEINNNTVITLTYRGKYDSTLGYALRTSVVNSLASL